MGTKQLKAVCLCDSDMKEIWNKDILFCFSRVRRHCTQKAPHWLCGGHDTMKGCHTIELLHNRPKAAVATFIWKPSQAVDKLWNQNVTWVPWEGKWECSLSKGLLWRVYDVMWKCFNLVSWEELLECLALFKQRFGFSKHCTLTSYHCNSGYVGLPYF